MRKAFVEFITDPFNFAATLFGLFFVIVLIAALSAILAPVPTAFDQRDAFVQVCLKSERYTRAECLILAGTP